MTLYRFSYPVNRNELLHVLCVGEHCVLVEMSGFTSLLSYSGAGIAYGAYNSFRTGDPSHFNEDAQSMSGIKGIVKAISKITGISEDTIHEIIIGILIIAGLFLVGSVKYLLKF